VAVNPSLFSEGFEGKLTLIQKAYFSHPSTSRGFQGSWVGGEVSKSALKDFEGVITHTQDLISQLQQELAINESNKPALEAKVLDIKNQKYSLVKEVKLAMKDLGVEGEALVMLSTTGLFEKSL
jgi:hypothetical protein